MSGEETPEERAARLLTWATLLAMVAIAVLIIDFGLKNQIVKAAGDEKTKLAKPNHQPADARVRHVDDGSAASSKADPDEVDPWVEAAIRASRELQRENRHEEGAGG